MHSENNEQDIRIVDYTDAFHDDFVRLSVSWISEHWPIEPRDRYELEHVSENIIAPGGFILMALRGGRAVGTVAMLRMDGREYDYELAKFTTSSEARGLGIGRLLITEALRRADESVGQQQCSSQSLSTPHGDGSVGTPCRRARVYIVTNHLCEAAIHLYGKFGFRLIPGKVSPDFERGDVLMERKP